MLLTNHAVHAVPALTPARNKITRKTLQVCRRSPAILVRLTALPATFPTHAHAWFDNVRVEELSHTAKTVKFRRTNPAKFAAVVSVLVESAKAAGRPVGSFVLKPLPVVHLDAGVSATLEYTASGSSRN